MLNISPYVHREGTLRQDPPPTHHLAKPNGDPIADAVLTHASYPCFFVNKAVYRIVLVYNEFSDLGRPGIFEVAERYGGTSLTKADPWLHQAARETEV